MEGEYVGAKRNGTWVIRGMGGVFQGPMKDGERDGKWVERFRDGTVLRGRYSNDEKTGRWTERYPDGDELEGSYSFGRKNGRWKLHRRGQTHEIQYSNGMQVR